MRPSARRPSRSGWYACWLLAGVAWIACGHAGECWISCAVADESDDAEEDEGVPYRPGAIARFGAPGGVQAARLDDEILLTGDASPDERIAAGPFTAHYAARVLVQAPGTYRLHAHAAGRVRVALAGQTVIDAHAARPSWMESAPVELAFGYHPLEVVYERDSEPAVLAIYWEGPGFALEPLAARWLFHDREETPADDFERGRQLARAKRCAACHDLPGEAEPLRAPALDRLAGNLAHAWIVERLIDAPAAAEQTGGEPPPLRNMPRFELTPDEAAAVADYLLASSVAGNAPDEAAPETDARDPKAPQPSEDSGRTLFHSVGCVACHRVGAIGNDGPFAGGDLSDVARKRPPGYFARWLSDPKQVNRHHRMPRFSLAAWEVQSLSQYLQSLGIPPKAEPAVSEDRVARGAKLVRAHRCGACHALPESDAPASQRLPLPPPALAREEGHCLAEPRADAGRPGYRADADQRRALTAYLQQRVPRVDTHGRGRHLLAEHNCTACHARGGGAGLAPHLAAIAASGEQLGAALPLLKPPSLAGVGDKLRDEALAAAIGVADKPRQPWLQVRMPRFPLTEEETEALVAHLIAADRIPPRGVQYLEHSPDDVVAAGAGARLVTADGFGCTSCHAIGKWQPQKVAPGSEGAALSHIAGRVRREWFERWVRNPARIASDMEMPAIVKPIRGVLDDDLDRQIGAIWHVLNRRGFTPPAPNALRVVRHANLPNDRAPAAVLTDVIEVGQAAFVKPLVLAFANRHNVLYDLEEGRLAAWWTGDAARQQTRGKTWFWQAGLPQLLPATDAQSRAGAELVLIAGGVRLQPVRHGQFLTEFDTLAHAEQGVAFAHRLTYELDGQTIVARLTQRFVPRFANPDGGASGFQRCVEIAGLPAGATIEFMALPGTVDLDANGTTARGVAGSAALEVRTSPTSFLEISEQGAVLRRAVEGDESVAFDLEYRAHLAVDTFTPLPPIDRSVEQIELDVVPGFEAVRLPLSDQCMPTGMAWRADGALVVSSLEGRVWLARDTDGDGLEDAMAPLSDDLAAPYGVAVAGDAVDVANKYGLLRLHDDDGDGRAERIEQIASGWGHTRDYHDWAVGLVRDEAGNYYVALPCEQDNRSDAAAYLRGRALRLTPRQPSPDNPRLYDLHEICGGLRFPQGLARSPDGALFATDNQGNYNPFNELNHLQAGKRYGFINSLEAKRGLKPPVTHPAINIPHPWTRSVNGICFLTLPSGGNDQEHFGPFAGHLVGCEYDTRRLVRMSLEQIDGVYQGAVYPFSSVPSDGAETFEGPVSCAVSPRGEVYVGNMRDSGWGGGSNTGSLVRLRWRGDLPAGIAEVRRAARGFRIWFTHAVDAGRAADAANYAIASYRRVSTPIYGGPDVDRRIETIRRVRVADDARSVDIELAELRAGFVYEFHLQNLAGAASFFPSEAYYTVAAADD